MARRLVMIMLAAIVSAVVCADGTGVQKRRGPRRHKIGTPSGGIIEKAYSGKVFRILNFQKDYPRDGLAALTKEIRYSTLLPVECAESGDLAGKNPYAMADELVADGKVGAGALVISDPAMPIEVLSPDRRWGILNIAPLKADSPSPEKFKQRFMKVYWGIIARTLGAGNSSFPGCVLVPFTSMAELDGINATRPCPEPFNKMLDTGKAYGIGTITITTYRRACEEGWAPAPTNDVQRAIWEQVKADKERGPTNPIKIEPPGKKK